MSLSNNLQHVGVLGMKWGRRKDSNGSSSKSKSTDKSYESYIRRERIDEWIGSKGRNPLPRKISNKKMKDIEKEMDIDWQKSKRHLKIALLVVGTMGLVVAADKFID